MGRKQKTTEEVREILKNYGYILDENVTFKNVKEKMEATTTEGYRVLLRFNDIPRYEPQPFHKNNTNTIWNIKNIWLPKNAPDYELLSEVYSGTESIMRWKHKYLNLPILEMSWHCFQDQKRHPELGYLHVAESNKKDSENVLNEIKLILRNEDKYKGWKICDIDKFKYNSHHQIVNFIHDDGYISSSEIGYILNRNGLVLFHTKHPEISIHNIETYIENNHIKYSLKEGQMYKGRHEKLVFVCPEHGEFPNNFNQICFKKVDCPDCLLEKISGENSTHYNSDLTNEDRFRHRYLQGIGTWVKSVKKRDNFTCQCCGRKDIQIHAHHIDGYNWCREKRLDLDNGITLCHLCHKDGENSFHKIYTNKNNTREQFIEWIRTYKNQNKIAMELLEKLLRDDVIKCV